MPGAQYQKYAHTRNMAVCCWRRPRSDTFDVPRFRTPYDRKTIHAEKSYGSALADEMFFVHINPGGRSAQLLEQASNWASRCLGGNNTPGNIQDAGKAQLQYFSSKHLELFSSRQLSELRGVHSV
jgi:hypothetical protein